MGYPMKHLPSLLMGVLILTLPFALAAGGGGGGSTRDQSTCTEDTWTCGAWSACSKANVQTRSCTMTVDCSTTATPKPVETASCTYVSRLLSKLKCHDLPTLKDRVSCRLGLSNANLAAELQIAYLPEECRALTSVSEQEQCVSLYSRSQPCWKKEGSERKQCLRKLIGIASIPDEKKACGKDPACISVLRKRAYGLIKFSIYDLEERAEGWYVTGIITQDKAATIIAALEEHKVAFNQAASPDERRQVLLDVKAYWKSVIAEVRP
ncbi:hypothetical protein HZB02_07165 [Candidatus Woesearchaeota archaeon]|nr:hypothetical protein [Candidatus Woesearchaeota archaeon]